MATNEFSSRLHDAVENYYQYNPDTLMPLLMLALAAQDKIKLNTKHDDSAHVFCEVSLSEITNYDWVQFDPSLKKRVKTAIANGETTFSIEGDIDPTLMDIYDTFHHYDTFTVNEEYHHRIGILYEHSNNAACDKAHRQYAMICLAEVLIDAPSEWLSECFLKNANHMLVKSGLQPERPRLQVAYTLRTLLDYDGEGKVYNPFAGCAIAAAAINASGNMYADGNANDKLFAVARLLNYGMGGSNEHYAQRDSTKWTDAGKFDYVMSTYRGYVNGQSAFDFCLGKCFDTLTDNGKFAGIVAPKDIFEKQSPELKEALKRDWIETIVLLPFGEVAVLVNAKKEKEMKSKIRFYDLTHPMLRSRPIQKVLSDDDYADILRVSDVKKKGYLRSLVVPEFEERDGYEIVTLGSLVKKMQRKTYSLARVPEDERVLAVIDRKRTYNLYERVWMNGIEKSRIGSLFAPAYHLSCDCLITNIRGRLEPRLFDSDNGSAFFQDGYAFEIQNEFDQMWLLEQLNEPYVLRQLHPYGMDKMVPEAITEEQILGLKLYKENEEEINFDNFESEEENSLPTGFILNNNNFEYTIHRFLGNGNFGYAYSAESHNLATGETREVVLKEFYPCNDFHRESGKVVANNEYAAESYEDEKYKFRKEYELMKTLGNTKDSHIVPALDFFESADTDTLYYVMPFYASKSFEDFLRRGDKLSEKLAIETVVIPLCKALNTSQKYKVLHLDIKPDNVLIDDDGNAILTDFGTAKTYDEEGYIIDRRGMNYKGPFAAPELKLGSLSTYDPRPDMYGIAATIYAVVARSIPHTIMELGRDEEERARIQLGEQGCSNQFVEALIKGLQGSMNLRPANAQAFLNLFPGCENIKL